VTTASGEATPSGTQATWSGELRALTGLRAVAAVWVVLFHFHFTPLPGVAHVVDGLGPLITSGALGVDLFFVLSGFVISYTYLDHLGPALRVGATARFAWARVCRMWPVYALALHVFGIWLVARSVLGSDDGIAFQAVQPVLDVGQYVQQIFMVQLWDDPYFDGASWIGSTWSISAEWLAYLLFPVTALVFFRMRRLPALVLVAGAVVLMTPIAYAYLATGSPYFPWSWAVRVLCGFGAGVLVHLAVRRLARSLAPTAVTQASPTRRRASVLAAVLPVVIAAGLMLGELVGPGRGGAVILLFPLLVGALAVADRGPAMLLSTRWAVYGGRLSYGLYLVHIPVLEVYWLALRHFSWLAPDTPLAHAVGMLALVGSLALAAAAYHLVEEPSRRGLRALEPTLVRLRARSASGRRRVALVPVPDVASTADSTLAAAVARFEAKRRALAAGSEVLLPEPRYAASAHRPPTLAGALVQAQRRRAAHRAEREILADVERAEYVRTGYLHAGP
jgi:peptidoglycan/LPS O-acetylase OafA/YrhL